MSGQGLQGDQPSRVGRIRRPGRLRPLPSKRPRPITIALAGLLCVAAYMLPAAAAQAAGALGPPSAGKTNFGASPEPLCESRASLCADPYANPARRLRWPRRTVARVQVRRSGVGQRHHIHDDSAARAAPPPTASGAGATWNFELRPTFWFGLTLCDTESCARVYEDLQSRLRFERPRRRKPERAELHRQAPGQCLHGVAVLRARLRAPVRRVRLHGAPVLRGDDNRQPDARPEHRAENTAACNNYILGGPEPINWAYVTRSGRSQAPANPLFTGTFASPNLSAVNPDTTKDLLMSPGDRIRIHMYDTPAGFRTDLTDLTTGQNGSMTASTANGFGHILYTPATPPSGTCQEAPYAFHPEYSTANPRGNTWSAHTYNVAMSDEIGHFENCLALDANANCTQPGNQDAGGLDEDDGNNFCVPGPTRRWSRSTAVSARTRIGTGSRTRTTGLAPIATCSSTGCCIRRRCCSQVHLPRQDQLLDDRVRD